MPAPTTPPKKLWITWLFPVGLLVILLALWAMVAPAVFGDVSTSSGVISWITGGLFALLILAAGLFVVSRSVLLVDDRRLLRPLVTALARDEIRDITVTWLPGGRVSQWGVLVRADGRRGEGMVVLASFARTATFRRGRDLADQLGVPFADPTEAELG